MTTIARLLVGFLTLWSARGLPAQQARHHLLPVPASVQFATGRLVIDSNFTIALVGHSGTRLRAGVWRAIGRLEARTGIPLAREFGDSLGVKLVLRCDRPGDSLPALGEDESYTLDVSPDRAWLHSATVVGALRGLETFLQLVEADRGGHFVPAVAIRDQPRFPWRGLLIDVARHWEPIEVIKRTLDGMAAVKLNLLHWHLTEDQGFRIESRRYPRLHQRGSDGLYYTQAQVREVVAYAAERGIRVVPEFDLPGHATSWFVGYPQHASAPGPYAIERRFGVFDPTFDPTRESIYRFLDGFIEEMARLFPDPYLHIGGDEVNGVQWRSNRRIQAFMRRERIADHAALQARFNRRIERILAKHGKRMVGWDEIFHPELPKTVVVQSWRGQISLGDAARQGYVGILSAGYYLDHMRTAADHYLVDPLPSGHGLTEEEAARVLGGEACMWGEHVNMETIDSRIWPRLAAVAERLWSPAEVADTNDLYRRLAVISLQLEELGFRHEVHSEQMLRRLGGVREIEPLRVLVDVIQPVSFAERTILQKPTQLTPLTRLVDVARPDPLPARSHAALVHAVLADPSRSGSGRDELTKVFGAWRDLPNALDSLTDRSPLLEEAIPVARALAEAGSVGIETLKFLPLSSSNGAPPSGWRAAKLATLDRLANPVGLVRLAILPALRELVLAVEEPR